MIEREELLATEYYEQPYQKEKDYVEEMFLSEMFNRSDGLVFKGGTALSKFYGSKRFSDDLDFSLASRRARGGIAGALGETISSLSESYPTRTMRKRDSKEMTVYELSIRGPLFEMLNKYQRLKIEVDKKASVIETVGAFRRNPRYSDLRPYLALVMSEKEILAEKTVALLFRQNLKARDLYDIYFLMRKGVEIKVSLIDRKTKEFGRTFTSERLLKRVDAAAKIWEKELRRLLPSDVFVDYRLAKKTVIENFSGVSLI